FYCTFTASSAMARYFLEIAYDGTAYNGWQVQANGITVQESIEERLRQVFQASVPVTGSGRTDTGVHALCQVAHIDLDETTMRFTVDELLYKLNRMLPAHISIQAVRKVRDTAHARF